MRKMWRLPSNARGYVLIVIRGRKRGLAVNATGEQELAAEAAG